jgi:type IX secretion system PorP/SprF family membrane protein
MVETDDTGPISFTSIYAMYAYHMKVTRNAMLSLGIAAGFEQYRFNYGGLSLSSYNDPIISGSFNEYHLPKINVGAWLYKEDRFIGLSFRDVVAHPIDGFDQDPVVRSDAKRRMHFTLTAGKLIDMTEDFSFRPAVQLMYVGRSKAAIDVQGVIDYNSKVQVGLGFRGGHGMTALAKIDVFDYVTVAYAYDLTMNRLRYASPNTHEVTIGIQACAKDGSGGRSPCAAYD